MQRDELNKIIFSSLINIFSIYILNVLRGAKDTLIITKLGAELISTLKLYGVLPSAVIFTLIYTKLTNKFTSTQIYQLLIWLFISFFFAFSLLLYPNANYIHFDFHKAIEKFPFFKYHLIMISNWSYSLFYIFSDLWGSVMLTLMFWQLANQIYSVEEAKRNYPLLGITGEAGTMLSGSLLSMISLPGIASDWDISLKYICVSVFFAGIIISLGVRAVEKRVPQAKLRIKHKKSVSIKGSIKYILSSRYILFISLLMLCYGMSITIMEGVWKKHISILYSDALSYCNFMAKVQIATSTTTIIAMVISFLILRRLKWHIGALITPVVFALTGIPFFMFVIYKSFFTGLLAETTSNILLLSVLIGTAQIVLAKACKYSFFEPTKEILYIPLDAELKSKGKGVADVMGERLGKATGAALQWGMLSFIGGSTLVSIAPYLFITIVFILMIWIYAVLILGKEFGSQTCK